MHYFSALVLVAAFWSNGASAQHLTLWEHELQDIQKALDRVISDFQQAHPKIKIKRSHYKTEDLRTQFQTAAMGGGGADVVLAPNDFGGPFSVMGIIQPVHRWGKLERFFDKVVAAVRGVDGQVWGLPISRGNHLMLFVNRKLAQRAPATVEELIAIAKRNSDPKNRKYGFAYNLTEPFWFVAFLGAFGETPLTDAGDGAKPMLDGNGMVDALSLVKQFKFGDKIVPPDCDYACAETLFVEGRVPMIINGDWSVQKYKGALKDELIIAPLPKLAKTGKHMAPMISGKYLFFNQRLKGKKLEAAKAFAEFLVSPKIQERLVRETRRLPALKSLAESRIIANDPILKATDAAMTHGQPMPMAVEMRVVWDAIRPQLQAVMAGRTEPNLAAKVMQKDAQVKIKEMREM